MKKFLVVLACLFVLVNGSGWADLLVNGSFDVPSDSTNWAGSAWTAEGAFRVPEASRRGARGVWVDGESADSVQMVQQVSAGPGTYTLSFWYRASAGYDATGLTARLEWFDQDTNELAEATTWSPAWFPHDSLWHQAWLTGTCSSGNLAFVRVRIVADHDAVGAEEELALDDAELYGGTFRAMPYLENGGFEEGLTNDAAWYGTEWNVDEMGVRNSRRSWGSLSGDWAAILEGWGGDQSNRTVLSQNLYPEGTGTWTFSVWIKREGGMAIDEAELSLEWRDAAYSNVLCSSVTNLGVLATNWTRYTLTADCGDTNAVEMRAVAEFVYDSDTGLSSYLDDARVVQEPYTNPLVTDWAYFNNPHHAPTVEKLPGAWSSNTFLSVNYAASSTVFRLLTDGDGIARYPNEEGIAHMYISYRPPHLTNDSDYISTYTEMTRVGSVTLTNGAFHGAPAAGTKSLDVWTCNWEHPASNGVPYSEPFRVFYAPYLETRYGGQLTGQKYLVRVGAVVSNNYPVRPQMVSTNFKDQDYYYWHQAPATPTLFTNGEFEAEGGSESNWLQTGWTAMGQPGRGDWYAHSGRAGAFLPGWHTLDYIEEQVLQQYVATTGGVYTFSAWVMAEPGVNPALLHLRLDWFDADGEQIQSDCRPFSSIPKDESWHHLFVTGTNTDGRVVSVVPTLHGSFYSQTSERSRLLVDDTALYAGPYKGVHSLANPGFSAGSSNGWFSGSSWYAQTQLLGNYRAAWGGRDGGWCALFDGTDTNAQNFSTRISQPMTPGTGTYTFAVWMLRDTNFVMTNASIMLEWYDQTLTNKVQADTVHPVNPPMDNAWREYYVTGTCTQQALYEVRASVRVDYTNTLALSSNGATLRIDDARFYPGDYAPALLIDWGYHGAGAVSPLEEPVPGPGGFGSFLQIDYARTSTTFYVLADHPTVAPTSAVSAEVGIRVAYWNRFSNDWTEVWTGMSHVGSAVLDDTEPFHGAPLSGGHTVDVYRYSWNQPLDLAGVPDTAEIPVWYCPYFRTFSGVTNYEHLWLLRSGEIQNAYPQDPQTFGVWYKDRDYAYTNRWTPDQDEDGLPDLWELRHFTSITNCDPNEDSDGDLFNNRDEYVADSLPRDILSFFHGSITAVSGTVGAVRIDAPTTNSRMYDIYWKTNLLCNDAWIRCERETAGMANGSNLWINIQNVPAGDHDILFFRSGVIQP